MSFEVHRHHRIPVSLAERSKHAVTIVTRVVDHAVQITECGQSLLYGLTRALVIRDVRLIDSRLAPRSFNFSHYGRCRRGINIVNQYLGSRRRKRSRMGST